jgi:MinD superfamily P-loop ATPase
MKEFVIISGKGGTGKTSLTAAFALLAERPVLCDADVDAADLHLLLAPDILQRHDFTGGKRAVINRQKCTQCGVCRDLCRFEAISPAFEVDAINCEGCGVCVDLCPENAVDFITQKSGEWFVSDTRTGPMVHARLGIAEENSGKLVSLIRRRARQLAEDNHHQLLITDGPPGIGCPVIASITGAEAVVIIVEPTISGIHDIRRVIGLIKHFGIAAMLCVNRFDINIELTEEIEQFAKAEKITVLPQIPFDQAFTLAMVEGKTLVEYAPDSATSKILKNVWQSIITTAETTVHPLKLSKHLK